MTGLLRFTLVLSLLLPVVAAGERLPLIDCHLHYNADAVKTFPPALVIDWLDQAGIERALVSSTPNDGTRALVAADPRRFVPLLRLYSSAADLGTWFRDPKSVAMVEDSLAHGRYRGIGEFHVSGENASTEVVRRIAMLAESNGLLLHAHSDATAIEKLFQFAPKATVIWAHTGMDEPIETVRDMLSRHTRLYAELSYRAGLLDGDKLNPGWRAMLIEFSDRFVYGSDTWTTSRWPAVPALAEVARGWLAQLPLDVARKIAYENARRLLQN